MNRIHSCLYIEAEFVYCHVHLFLGPVFLGTISVHILMAQMLLAKAQKDLENFSSILAAVIGRLSTLCQILCCWPEDFSLLLYRYTLFFCLSPSVLLLFHHVELADALGQPSHSFIHFLLKTNQVSFHPLAPSTSWKLLSGFIPPII